MLAVPGAATAGKSHDRGHKHEHKGGESKGGESKGGKSKGKGGESKGGKGRKSGSSRSGSSARSLASSRTAGRNQRPSARSSSNDGNRGGNGNRGNGDGDGGGDATPSAVPAAGAPATPPAPGPNGRSAGRRGSPAVSAPSAAPFAGVAPVAPIVALTADRVAGNAARGARPPVVRTRLAAAERSPIERTVREVVEVVPPIAWGLIALLAALTLLGAGASWLLAARKRSAEQKHRALLSDVGALQRALLPPSPEQIAGVATSVAYRPVSGSMAGGDLPADE